MTYEYVQLFLPNIHFLCKKNFDFNNLLEIIVEIISTTLKMKNCMYFQVKWLQPCGDRQDKKKSMEKTSCLYGGDQT